MKNYKQKVVEPPTFKKDFTAPSITEYMVPRKKLVTFRPDTEIIDVVETLLKKKITGAPVLNEKGELVGLIDDKDCIKVLIDTAYYKRPIQRKLVADYTTNELKTISVNSNIVDAAQEFSRTIYKRLLIIGNKGELVGQISRRDVLWAIGDYSKKIF